MLGNDIIDLNLAKIQSNWLRKGYLDKLYTEAEQKMISSFHNPEIMVWMLWSIKEATYKANNRITNVKEYAPSKIECFITSTKNNWYFGKSMYRGKEFQFQTEVAPDYILTRALHNSDHFDAIKEILLKNYPHDYAEYLEKNNYFAPHNKIVKNQQGVPNLHNAVTKKYSPISISHHGNFLSVLCI